MSSPFFKFFQVFLSFFLRLLFVPDFRGKEAQITPYRGIFTSSRASIAFLIYLWYNNIV